MGDKTKSPNVGVIADIGILKTVETSGVATWCLRKIPVHLFHCFLLRLMS
nr:MAG TPA: hypothetical protein [Caudoviricetes sp.]